MEILGRRGLLEPMDYSKMRPTLKDELLPGMTAKYGVGQAVFGLGIVYNTNKFSKENHPKNWKEFWDANKFPGPRTLPDASNDITAMEAALLADGVPHDKLYPLDVDRAFRSLDKIRPHVVKFFAKSAEGQQILTDQVATLGGMTFGRIIALRDDDPKTPLDMEISEAMVKPFFFVIPKGAKNADNAYKMIDYYMKAENLGRFTNAYPAYGPANPKAIDFVDEKKRASIITNPANAPSIIVLRDDWWIEEDASGKTNTEKVLERWVAWAR
jgi:putative spermidine/putrescine transport system substrate-binding protein